MRLWTNKNLKLALLLAVVSLSSKASGQQLQVTIKATPESSRVTIDGRGALTSKWSFIDTYGSVLGLARRIENFQLFNEAGAALQVHALAPGQFESEKPAAHFKYEVNLSPPAMAADAAMVSWLTRERGLLILGDLLPAPAGKDDSTSAEVRFDVPAAYAVQSAQLPDQSGTFLVPDITQAVFALGGHLRTTRATESSMSFCLIADGDWAFTETDVLEMVQQILRAERQVFGAMPAKNAGLILLPYPQSGSATRWSAETRGNSVTLLMGKLPSKVGALAQMNTPLTHELFHLWVPNALTLKGDYDWFYEGFTVYQAARLGVRLNFLTWQQFLNALAHAYDVYLQDPARDRWSLAEASQRRWTGGSSSVYSKSMLVALLIDLKMRQAGSKDGLDRLYQKLFAKYQTRSTGRPEIVDGNDSILALLRAEPALQGPFAAGVANAGGVDLPKELAPYGLSVERFGANTRIAVAEPLTKRQRDLLRELGYNAAGHSAR
jgi:predicted metalloprotease with PDZ domain